MIHRHRTIVVISAGGAGVMIIVTAAVAGVIMYSGKPDESACKAAMRAGYAKALRNPAEPAQGEPAACRGIPAATASRFAVEIMSSAIPSPDARACEAFADQVQVLDGIPSLSPADVRRFADGVNSDSQLADGRLSSDLSILYGRIMGQGDIQPAADQVRRDCAAIR